MAKKDRRMQIYVLKSLAELISEFCCKKDRLSMKER